MMTVYLANAFSLSMLSSEAFKREGSAIIIVTKIDIDEVKRLLRHGFVSAVGHEATATLLSQLLGFEVRANRIQVSLGTDDKLIVFQLMGRLPEGRVLSEEELKTLPYQFFLVTVMM